MVAVPQPRAHLANHIELQQGAIGIVPTGFGGDLKIVLDWAR